MELDPLFAAPIGALLICLLRITDVSMSIMRMILAVRGHRVIAALIGFFEVLIWLIAVGKALEHLHSIIHVIGYAGGFAVGNYVGVWLEGRFALGVNVVRAVIRRPRGEVKAPHAVRAARLLRSEGFAVTEIEGRGLRSYVDILNVVTPRRRVPNVIRIIRDQDPTTFLSVEEVRSVEGGYVRPGGRKLPFLTTDFLPARYRKKRVHPNSSPDLDFLAFDADAPPVVGTIAGFIAGTEAGQIADPKAGPIAGTHAVPIAGTNVELIANTESGPIAGPNAELIANTESGPIAATNAELIANTESGPIAATHTEQIADSESRPIAGTNAGAVCQH